MFGNLKLKHFPDFYANAKPNDTLAKYSSQQRKSLKQCPLNLARQSQPANETAPFHLHKSKQGGQQLAAWSSQSTFSVSINMPLDF